MLKQIWLGLGVLSLFACTNDYDEFDFSGGPRPTDASAQGGSSGTTQGTGGQAGLDAARPDSGGSGGRGGSGGSAPDAQGGTSGGGTGGTGTGGTGTGGTGGGTGGSGGACGQFQVRCGALCVDATDRGTCGGCNNNCEEQGFSAGFQCIDQRCGCTSSMQCGQNMSARCAGLSARCVCNGNQCGAGETCTFNGTCTCNGGPSCDNGEICCQNPDGCRTSCNSP